MVVGGGVSFTFLIGNVQFGFGNIILLFSGKNIVTPPQVLSMSFNDAGECYKLTGNISKHSQSYFSIVVSNTQGT